MENLVHRLQGLIQGIGRRVPGCWKYIEQFQSGRGKSNPDWPAWCFLPISAALAVVTKIVPMTTDPTRAYLPAILTGLASWRVTKGIYSFDAIVLESLWSTPIDKIPSEILFHLPEWCVYIPTPGKNFDGKPLLGFFVHLEHDTNSGRAELRFLLDQNRAGEPFLIPLALHLNRPTLKEAVEGVVEEAVRQISQKGVSKTVARMMVEGVEQQREIFPSLLSLTLYLCSEGTEIRPASGKAELPSKPAPTRTKNGDRFFEASQIRNWDCGWRIGEAIRKSIIEHEESERAAERRNSPRPHIRRAHFHHYWIGSGDSRWLHLKWLHPVLVNADNGQELPTVIRQVRAEK